MITSIIIFYIIGVWIAARRVYKSSFERFVGDFMLNIPHYILRSLLSWYTVVKLEEDGDGHYEGENKSFIEVYKKVIIRREEDGQPYLIRRTLFTFGKFFSIKYHQILLSDDVCPHDHPWSFITLMLKGGYYEWTPIEQDDTGKTLAATVAVDNTIEVKKWHDVGSLMYRPASWRHRLELKRPVNYYRPVINGKLMKDPIVAHTIVITGMVVRDWGFFTKSGWIFWKNYNKKRDC